MTKIAIIGSAPSSIHLAPYGDPSWQVWACSPGTYPVLPRCDKFFELHRWEPGQIGKPNTQVPWFSPEYCAWMAQQSCVVMYEAVPEITNSVRLEREALVAKYGSYNFTSSIAWMMAMAIDEVLASKDNGPHAIGLWGVDMAATEEYGYQRAGCQFFAQLAQQLGIQIVVPPESDILVPPPLYGVVEHSHMHIKLNARKKELENRLHGAVSRKVQASNEELFLQGALDDINYMMGEWIHDNSSVNVTTFDELFSGAPIAALQKDVARAETVLSEINDAVAVPPKGNGMDHSVMGVFPNGN